MFSFSSNQTFEISGTFKQLEITLRFALEFSGNLGKELFYQTTDDGKYCLGWYQNKDWLAFPFDTNVHIISEIIQQYIEKHKKESIYKYSDGGSADGFLMKVIENSYLEKEDGIKSPFYGIISIEYFENFYAK